MSTTQFSLKINPREYANEYKFETEIYPSNVTVLDEQRVQRELKVTGFSPATTDVVNCRWDREPITGATVPIPVRRDYHSSPLEYESCLNGNTYRIQDHINHDGATFAIDGYACSPNCARAFIEDNSHNPLYSEAESLLAQLLGYMPTAAPSWRLLKGNGGTMTIDEFRSSFGLHEYTFAGVVMKPIFFVYGKQYTIHR